MGTLMAARLWTVLCLVVVESSWALRSLGSPNRIVVSPSVAEADFLRLGSELESTIQAGAEWLHFPIDDRRRLGGVPLGPSVVAACRQSFPRTILDVMLGCNGPENRVNEFVRAGADIISVHPEATKRLGAVLQAIKAAGVAPGVVLSPTTSVATVESVLPHCQVAVILMPSPDQRRPNGIEQAVEKIRRLRFLRPDLHISVDGGIREQDDNLLISAGANVLVAGAGLFMSANQRAVIDYLKRKQAPQVGFRYRGQLDPLKRNKDAMFFASRPGEGPNQELVGRRLWSNLQPKATVSSKTSTFYNLKTGDVHRNEYVVWSNPNFQKETQGMFFPTPPELPKYPNHELTKAWADNPMGAVSSTSTSVYKLTNEPAPKDYVLWSDPHFHGGHHHEDMFFEPPELVQDPNHELSKVWSEYPVDGSATTTVYKRSSSALPNGYVLWSNQHDLVSSSADYSFAVSPNNEYKRTPDGNYMWSNPTGFVSSSNNLQTPNGMWTETLENMAPNGAVVSGDGPIPPQAQDYRPADGERSNGYPPHATMSPERDSAEANNGYQQQQQQQHGMRPDGTQRTNGSTHGYRQSNGYSERNRQNNGYSSNQHWSGFSTGGRVSTDSYTTASTPNGDSAWSGSTTTNGPKRYTPPPPGGDRRNWSDPKRNAADRAFTERNGYTQGGESTDPKHDLKRDVADHISAESYNGYTPPPQESTGSDPKRDVASQISIETYNSGYMPQGGEGQWPDPRSDASDPVSKETYDNAYMQSEGGDNTWSGHTNDSLSTGGVTAESYNNGYVQTDNGESMWPGSDPGSNFASQSYSNGFSQSDESTWSGPDQGNDVSSAGEVSSTEDYDNGYVENESIWSATNGVRTHNEDTTWPDSGQRDDNSSVDKVSIDTGGVPTQDPYDSSMWSGSNGSAYPEAASTGAASNGQAQTQNDDAMWSDQNQNDPFFAAEKAATETNQELAHEPSDKNMWFASEENAAAAGDSVSADTASTEANSAFLQDDVWSGTNENGVVSEADAHSTENSNVESAWPGSEPEESFFADMHEQVQTLRDEDLWPTSNENEVPEGGASVEANNVGETDQGTESSWPDSNEDVAPADDFPPEMPDMEARIPSEEEMWLGSNQIEPPPGTDNLYLPNYLEGTWQVTQTLTGTSKPGGWPIGGPSGEKSITQRYLEETLLEDAAGATMHMQLRYVRTKWGVTEDRLFNTHQRLNAMAGVPIVGDVQYGNVRTSNRAAILANGGSEFDPLQTTVTRYHIPATRKTFVLSHDSIPGKAKGFWVGCELQRSIFSVDDLSAPPPITMDSEFRWEFQPIDLHHVRAKLRVAEFKAETGAAQSSNQVSFRDYVLDMIRIGL